MQIIKPKRLRRGDVIGVCAPASPPTSEEKVEEGVRYIERCGYRVEVGRNVYHKHGYLAGSDRERAADLNTFFANRKVTAIFTARGGYGALRILPLLDYSGIRHNPKILVGYSDITAIQFAILAKTGLVTFSGPMVASDLIAGLSGEAEEIFWRLITSPRPLMHLASTHDEKLSFERRGSSAGRLLGGNLAVITALLGSDYFPTITNPIFLIEEIDERPYRIDRMLHQLKLAGTLPRLKGLALGCFTDCQPEKGKPSLTLDQIFRTTLRPYRYPVVSGFHYGHVKGLLTFPQGVQVRLNGRTGRIDFLEAGVV